MHLVATNQSIELSTSTDEEIEWEASYVDIPDGGDAEWASAQGQIAAVAETTVVAAPAASTARQLHRFKARNAGVASCSVQLQKDVAGTEYEITPLCPLGPGEWLEYSRDGHPRFAVYYRDGRRKEVFGRRLIGPTYLKYTGHRPNDITSVRTLTNQRVFAQYQGLAPRDDIASVVWRWRMTTAAVTVTAAEIAVGTATASALAFLGFADVSGDVTSTGNKSTTVSITSRIAKGMPLWFVIYMDAVTPGAVRASDQGDGVTSPQTLSRAATRPSLFLNESVSGTLETGDRVWAVGQC